MCYNPLTLGDFFMAKRRTILELTHGSGKFSYTLFVKLINRYIKENYMTYRNVVGPDGEALKDARGNNIVEKNVLSIPGFCCFAGIDCEEDFWTLMSHPNRDYAKLGKKLVTHIKKQMLDFLVNDKNNSYAALIGKTYFPDDENEESISKIPEKAKAGADDVDVGKEMSEMDEKERVKALRLLKNLMENRK